MIDRSATATIKGYFYQFDQTITRLLEGSKHASVTVEGIEDIDLDDGNDSAYVQCKYYEGSEYNHSLIKEAVIHMLRHYHAAGCPSGQAFKYRLYGHYKSGQNKLTLPFTEDFLKANFLTYKKDGKDDRGKVEYKVHDELGVTGPQLAAFLTLLDIDVNALSYDDQQTKLLELLKSAIPGCSDVDALVFYYPSAINVIQGLAIQADESKRKIDKERFLREVNRKDVVFNAWLLQKFGSVHYARSIRRKHFHFGRTKIPKASRFFIIDLFDEYDVNKATEMLVRMGNFFSHKELVRTPSTDRFCPYVLLRGVTTAELAELKRSLSGQGVDFNDGYKFLGADFSATTLALDPTREQLWRIKFVPSEDQLAFTIAAVGCSVVEIYDFYKTTPLDSANIPKNKIAHAIKCSNSYMLQEVMQA
ncbi:DUF4297 family anti-phage-associated protein [Achromobacter xylosoxidans]|uniref:DUF4297 family anti-phage-associated protein n=1 Tax=Alcaligenes xylosoxydans xylosoxydans TaxID=85698 RepID=UPI000B48D7B0|nr:DUF4297 family anti-phage-associated protein [Achromobacter xylosoxidans]